jgi:hypothetical protein
MEIFTAPPDPQSILINLTVRWRGCQGGRQKGNFLFGNPLNIWYFISFRYYNLILTKKYHNVIYKSIPPELQNNEANNE